MIILLGLPKSGTTSFHVLFKKLGLTSYHWKKDGIHIGTLMNEHKLANRPLLSNFNHDDCITQMDICISENNCYWPQITDYHQIYMENKDAIFILNKRDPYKLLSSFKRWGNLYNRLLQYNSTFTDGTEEGFIRFVNEHYARIENYFSSISYAKFIVFDIDNDPLTKLCTYIDIKEYSELPHANENTIK